MAVGPGPSLPSDVTEHTLATGSLESPLIWVGLLSAAVAVGYFLVRGRRHGVARGNTVTRVVVVGALVLGAAAFGLNDYVGYVRTPHDLAELMQRGTGGTVDVGAGLAAVSGSSDQYLAATGVSPAAHPKSASELVKVALPDHARGVPVGLADVLLPPGYGDPDNRTMKYPVVYLIHGYPDGNADDWFTSGDAQSTMDLLLADHLVRPMILVSPDMTAGQAGTDWECLNVPSGPQLEDYLVGTVVPGIDARFRTIADRGHRALGGMSGGAFCALNVGLQHLRQFGSLLLTLPYDSLGDSAGILGNHPNLVLANDPQAYLPAMAFPYPVSVLVDAGSAAPTDVATGRRITASLSARGQHAALHLDPGMTHTWRTARAALPYLLVFADQVFTTPTVTTGTPTHHAPPGPRAHS
jgi:S-formylglutathione hydrolase FrmB